MTSKEILKASLLEIVFENRNKQYGAYALRKFYSNRLAIALALTMSLVFLACLLIRSSGSDNVIPQLLHDPLIITQVEIAHPDIVVPPPAVSHPAAAHQVTPDLITPVIVDDNENISKPLPSITELSEGGMPNTGGVEGGTGEPGPSTSVVVSTGNNHDPAAQNSEFHPVETPPQFPGGSDAWIAFLSRYLQIPGDLEAGEKKTVVVKFQVSDEGIVTNFEVIQSAGKSFDNEVLRVLKRMPKWKPAIQNNHKVATSFTQPVTFQSTEN